MPDLRQVPKADEWAVVGEDTAGPSGQLKVFMCGARGGVPKAKLDLWALSADDAVSFLRGCLQTLEAKYGRIITPVGSRN